MASKINVMPQKEEMLEQEDPETQSDRPLLDLSAAAVKELIRNAKKRGYVSHDQIDALLSSEEVKSEQIEDILANFSEAGVNVVDTKEAELEEEVATGEEPEKEAEGESPLTEVQQWPVPARPRTKEPADRTDDPVRLYFREMSSVELLSREGEVAIAKRIEAGRDAMIAGLCESPLTFDAIMICRDELNAGKVLLRDIVDLEATRTGPDATATQAVGPNGQVIVDRATPGRPGWTPQVQAPATAPAAPTLCKPRGDPGAAAETVVDADGMIGDSSVDDDDDEENWLSVAAIEAELKPKVIETLDRVAGTYKRWRRLQDQNAQLLRDGCSLSPAQQRRYEKLT